MSHRNSGPGQIASLIRGRNQTLDQVAQGAAKLKPFLRAWSSVVPKPANNYIHPACYKDGRLTVWVHSPVWAHWLRHRQSLIIRSIRACNLPDVHTVSARLVPERRTAPFSKRESPSPETSRTIAKCAQTIQDPELRKSLERLVKSFSNKSG